GRTRKAPRRDRCKRTDPQTRERNPRGARTTTRRVETRLARRRDGTPRSRGAESERDRSPCRRRRSRAEGGEADETRERLRDARQHTVGARRVETEDRRAHATARTTRRKIPCGA